MKKNITGKGMAKRKQQARKQQREDLTIGIDVGDRSSSYCILDETGEVLVAGSLKTTRASLGSASGSCRGAGWRSRPGPTRRGWSGAGECGHEVIVANARAIPLLTANSGKRDPIDAEMLARMARVDPKYCVRSGIAAKRRTDTCWRSGAPHIGGGAHQADERRARAGEAARRAAAGLFAGRGQCAPGGGTGAAVRAAIEPLLEAVEALNLKIQEADKRIEAIAREHYAEEVRRLTQVKGVGTLVALTFVLTLEDPARFRKSREVGCYIGARPGETNREKAIRN